MAALLEAAVEWGRRRRRERSGEADRVCVADLSAGWRAVMEDRNDSKQVKQTDL